MKVLEAALKYLEAGLACIPVWRDRRKNPHLSSFKQYENLLPSPAEWARWADRWPRCNVALITGYWRNLVALDFDSFEDYYSWCAGPGFGWQGQTWTVRTGRGYHVYFYLAEDPGNSRSFVSPDGVEVLLRARGGYVIAPPSIHHTGAKYKTVHKVEPIRADDVLHILEPWEEKKQAQNGAQRPRSAIRIGTRIEELIPVPDGAKPNSRGAYQVFCPFHEDHAPSAWLNVDQQRFGCNACWPGLWWDVVNVYAMLHGMTNGEAYKVLGTAPA